MARRKLIAGNWKMNGQRADGLALLRGLVDKTKGASIDSDVLVCPPFTLIAAAADVLSGQQIAVGGQDCHAKSSGAHTGDIAAAMLKDAGAAYVILGHSERRADHGESDAVVRAKAAAALEAGLVAIICVGETLAERDAGKTLEVVARQLAGSLPDGVGAGNIVIAYEPVWAIGTGKVATPEQAQEVHAAIRKELEGRLGRSAADELRILYGGSMKPDNAAQLLALPDVDGGLIGGASLKVEDFWAIIAAAG